MAEIPDGLLVHTVDVETYLGTGAYGDVFGSKTSDVACFRDGKIRMVRNPNGDEVVSQTTLYLKLSRESAFAAKSRVTWSGHEAFVILAATRDDGGMGAWQHLEVNLT